VKSTKQRRIW